MSRETRALLRKHSQSVMVKHFVRLIHFCSCLYSKTREERAGIPTKENQVVYGTFLFCKGNMWTRPGSKCFLNSKAHTRLVFPCTMHNSPLSRRQYFPSGLFPPPLLQQTTWSWKSFAPTWKSVLSEKHLQAIWKWGRPLWSQIPRDPLFFKFKRSFYEVEASKAALGLSLQFCEDCGSQLATLHGINFLMLSGKDIRSKLALVCKKKHDQPMENEFAE